MIDLHSHVLYGIDDGAEDLDEAVAICRAASDDGISVLAATPHVRDDYPTTPEQMEAALAEVQNAVGDALRLVPGGELDLTELGRPREELVRFALAGNPGYLLVETPYLGWPLDFADRLFGLPRQVSRRSSPIPSGTARSRRGPSCSSRSSRAACWSS